MFLSFHIYTLSLNVIDHKFLDNCCFNRPYDIQNNLLIYLEAEAKLFTQELILQNKIELVWSFILDYENEANPYNERKQRISEWRNFAVYDCILCEEIVKTAGELMKLNLRQKDASHIACALFAKADYFLTTDKKILNKAVKNIQLVNPIDFVRRYLDE